MKHTVISVILLSLILSFSLWTSHAVTKAASETSALLEQAMTLERQGNSHSAIRLAETAQARWKSRKVLFGTVLRHDEVDEVMLSFAELLSYARSREREEFFSSCASLLARLQHIRDMEKPSFHNIM